MTQFAAMLPNGKRATFASRVNYTWGVAVQNFEGGSYLLSKHTSKDLARKAAGSFMNNPNNRGYRAVLTQIWPL